MSVANASAPGQTRTRGVKRVKCTAIALIASAVVFVSKAAAQSDLRGRLGVAKYFVAVENTRGGISKASMVHNDATPDIKVDPDTYEVTADGELLTCAPAEVLPMAQRYFLF